jgi:hypothetical protein
MGKFGYVFSFYLLLLLQTNPRNLREAEGWFWNSRRFLNKLKTEQAEITDDGGYFQYRQLFIRCSRQHNFRMSCCDSDDFGEELLSVQMESIMNQLDEVGNQTI